jgi:hypothetical protein
MGGRHMEERAAMSRRRPVTAAGDMSTPLLTKPVANGRATVWNRSLTALGDMSTTVHLRESTWLASSLSVRILSSWKILIAGNAATCAPDGPCATPSTPYFVDDAVLSVGVFSGIMLIATGRDSATMVRQ